MFDDQSVAIGATGRCKDYRPALEEFRFDEVEEML